MTPADPGITYHELLWMLSTFALVGVIVTLHLWRKTDRHALATALPETVAHAGPHADSGADRDGWREAMRSMRELDGRTQVMEHSLQHLTSSTDFAELEGTVRTIQAQYTSLAEGQQSIRATLFRIEDFLLKGKRS